MERWMVTAYAVYIGLFVIGALSAVAVIEGRWIYGVLGAVVGVVLVFIMHIEIDIADEEEEE